MKVDALKKKFTDIYGGTAETVRIFEAPGRVNLIGEHTDYNGGFVLPAALNLTVKVAARPREDGRIRLYAADLGVGVDAEVDRLEGHSRLKWGNYQLGAAWALRQAGHQLTGCELLYDENVPFGAGLSSSAATETATAYALASLSGAEITLPDIARLCQKAENAYVGVACGIMDPFASALGKENCALFLNCRSLEYAYVPVRLSGYRLVIAHTNKKRSLAESKYNERRAECEAGFGFLKRALPEAACLGDVTPEAFYRYGGLIGDETVRRRAAHVVMEDDRVVQSVKALRENDLEAFGRLMTASHRSLRDLYEVTGVELDTLFEEALKIDGVLGARMTGVGFGGCTVNIMKEASTEKFIAAVGENYRRRTGLTASFYLPAIGGGVREVYADEK